MTRTIIHPADEGSTKEYVERTIQLLQSMVFLVGGGPWVDLRTTPFQKVLETIHPNGVILIPKIDITRVGKNKLEEGDLT